MKKLFLNEVVIAVIVPCYNEEVTIAKVIRDFQDISDNTVVYVYDNNSQDRTVEVATQAGARVRTEPEQGKGNVVRRMFADVDADIYVLVDGDDTYDASVCPSLIEKMLDERLDMVVGIRKEETEAAYRRGHSWGNKMFNDLFRKVIGNKFSDIFSGYRVFSRRFVKSFPALSSGFEIETEISIHAEELKIPTAEVATTYFARPEGSESKLNTYKDGLRILWTIVRLYKEIKPLRFFSGVAGVLLLVAVLLGLPLVHTWMDTGLVPRFPTAFIVVGTIVLSAVSLTCGLILSSVTRGRLEQKRLRYLSLPWLS